MGKSESKPTVELARAYNLPDLDGYATKDEQHNSAVVLRQYIQQLGISA